MDPVRLFCSSAAKPGMKIGRDLIGTERDTAALRSSVGPRPVGLSQTKTDVNKSALR